MAAEYEVQKTNGIPSARSGYQVIGLSGTYLKGCRTVQAIGFDISFDGAKSLRDDVYTPKYDLMLQEEGADWYQFLILRIDPNVGTSVLIETSPMKRRELSATVLQPVKKKAATITKKTMTSTDLFDGYIELSTMAISDNNF